MSKTKVLKNVKIDKLYTSPPSSAPGVDAATSHAVVVVVGYGCGCGGGGGGGGGRKWLSSWGLGLLVCLSEYNGCRLVHPVQGTNELQKAHGKYRFNRLA